MDPRINPQPDTPYHLSINQTDKFGNDTSEIFPLVFNVENGNPHRNTITPKILINSTDVTLNGHPGDTGVLVIRTSIMTTIAVAVSFVLGECPPGYVSEEETCVCSVWSKTQYHMGIRYCAENYTALTFGFWAGYLNISDPHEDNFVTGTCNIDFCGFQNHQNHLSGVYELPRFIALEKLNDFVCSVNREGILCSKCKEDFSVYYHSPFYSCKDSSLCYYGVFFYILSELLPITVIFVVIIVFNIYLTSGTLYTLILYSQIIDNLFPNAFNVIQFNNDGLSFVIQTL